MLPLQDSLDEGVEVDGMMHTWSLPWEMTLHGPLGVRSPRHHVMGVRNPKDCRPLPHQALHHIG